jgi:hypothetical protein
MECPRCKKSLAYEKVVKEVNKRMSAVEKTPQALSHAAMDLFGVNITLRYLMEAKNNGLMKMRVCNRIASELKKVR